MDLVGISPISDEDLTSASVPEIGEVRELGEKDLLAYDNAGTLNQAVIGTIKTSHHRIAALLATGISQVEIARRTGYGSTTITSLKSNPAFADLIAFYKEKANEYHDELLERMETTALELLDEIQGRLSDPAIAGAISFNSMTDTLTKLLDRIGHSAVHRTENKNLNVNLGAGTLGDIRKKANEFRFDPASNSDRGNAPPQLPATVSGSNGSAVGEKSSPGPLSGSQDQAPVPSSGERSQI